MTTLERLKMGRGRVSRGWCQGTYALNENGGRVDYDSKTAVRWCLNGAVSNDAECWRVLLDLKEETNVDWNDAPGRTQAEVVALFDKAIEKLEAQAKESPDAR